MDEVIDPVEYGDDTQNGKSLIIKRLGISVKHI